MKSKPTPEELEQKLKQKLEIAKAKLIEVSNRYKEELRIVSEARDEYLECQRKLNLHECKYHK